MSKVVIDNQDESYKVFTKLLAKSGILGEEIQQLRCKKAPMHTTLTNKFKKVQLDFQPFEGQYVFTFQEQDFRIIFQRGQPLILTECRQLEYEKKLTIYGPSIHKIKQFVDYVFHLIDNTNDDDMITVYENNGGYWRISKEKKPRKLESVIFNQQFTDRVLADIQDFIDSEQWYTEMGIPYKRSYLLYGPPGTGKSSFAQALAGHIKFSICFVNCSDKINDFNFNTLLNQAPKKSLILIEDVDAIFSERKNTQKNNSLTFSGFLNAIDGVRSQQGRIIVMTTNYKQRLDPALLRPGRVDEMFQITYSTHYQIQKMCYRFYKKQQLAKQFAKRLPQGKFSMSQIQGFLLKYRVKPQLIIDKIDDLLNSDQNIKIGQFLQQINCHQCVNDFKIQQCFTLAQAKNLPRNTIQKIADKLNSLLKGRLLEVVRMDRRHYIKSYQSIQNFIIQSVQDQNIQRKIKKYVLEHNVKTFYVVRDLAKKYQEMEKKQQKIIEEKLE